MATKSLFIIAGGLILLWIGLRSVGGYEESTKHLYGGQWEEITCEDGKPTGGKGVHVLSADVACEQVQDDQRGRAPWWILAGIVVTGIGLTQFRKARS
ncbi:MAG TPA: hypothetical protein VGJ86_01800 [Acidimicrobiales bacterium]|jgi:hypothetical protein